MWNLLRKEFCVANIWFGCPDTEAFYLPQVSFLFFFFVGSLFWGIFGERTHTKTHAHTNTRTHKHAHTLKHIHQYEQNKIGVHFMSVHTFADSLILKK